MLCEKIISKISPIAIFFVATILLAMLFIGSNFEQSEGTNQTVMESANQTLQNISQTVMESANQTLQNISQTVMESANQTLQNMSQTVMESANQTLQNMSQTINNTKGEAILQKNSTDIGSNLTEVAKKLAKSIDEGIKNLSQ